MTRGCTDRVFLVDASPYIFRAFHSLPPTLTDPRGRPVGAVYGFIDFLLRLLRERRPTHLAVTFDDSLTTSFRNRIYPEYKAKRPPPPPELEAQVGLCREAVTVLGAVALVESEYEADDLIATLCRRFQGDGAEIVIVTSDKDLTQLVGPGVRLLDFARDRLYGPEEVHDKLGVRPEQVADYLALAGDAVDNIPGVKGVGKKTARVLLGEFTGLEDLYERLDEVSKLDLRGAGGLARRLEEQREQAFLSLELAHVAEDAPVEADLETLRLRDPAPAELAAFFEKLGFDGILERALAALGNRGDASSD